MSGAVRVATGTDSVNSSAAETTGATVSPTTGVKPEQEKNFLQGVSNLAGQIGQFFGGGPPFPNELRDFASYNYIFTFGCLNNFEINFPDLTYRITDPSTVILKSGGNAGAGGATTYENNGKVEYYIDDVTIDTIVGMNPQT